MLHPDTTGRANGNVETLSDDDRAALSALRSDEASQRTTQPARTQARELKQKRQPARRCPEFDQLVKPLERAGDEHGPKRLNGWGLELCLAAFAEHPKGFAACVERVMAKYMRAEIDFPLGLLCRMVDQGEHAIDDLLDDEEGWEYQPDTRRLEGMVDDDGDPSTGGPCLSIDGSRVLSFYDDDDLEVT
jgi:hypothetical protein